MKSCKIKFITVHTLTIKYPRPHQKYNLAFRYDHERPAFRVRINYCYVGTHTYPAVYGSMGFGLLTLGKLQHGNRKC